MPEAGVLDLRLFGGLDIVFEGKRLEFPTRHSALLLAILALEPDGRMSRDGLAHLLWDTRGDAQSRASLRQALYHARRTLTEAGAPELLTDRGHVALPDNARSDVHTMLANLKDDPIRAASDYGGPILPGIGGFGPAFEEWLLEIRRGIEARFQPGLHAALAAKGMSAEARQVLSETLLRIDPFDEVALRHAMRALVDLDRRGAAIQLHNQTRAALDADLGVDLEQETRSLAEAIATEEPIHAEPEHDPAGAVSKVRRSVSALFLVTDVSEDPEEFSDGIAAFADTLRQHIDPDVVFTPAGPTVACIFGLKRPTERHTEVAIRALLVLRGEHFDNPAALVTGELLAGDNESVPDLAHLLTPALDLARRAGAGRTMLSHEAAQRTGSLPHELMKAISTEFAGLPATPPRPAPFTGRQADLELLDTAFNEVATAGGRLVAIVGEAGMGKTTLVRYFLENRLPASTAVLSIQSAEASSSRPFAVLGDLFNGVSDTPDIVSHVLGQGGDDTKWVDVPAAVRRRKLADAVLERISEASGGAPAVLVIEDLHWIDPETDALLHGVVNHLGNLPLLIIATHRPEYSGGWIGRSFFRLLQLEPLSKNAARHLLAELAPETDEPRREELLRRASGVPYFVVELARAQSEGATGIGLPSSIRDVLSAHLMRLPGPSLRLLQAASVLGLEFDEAVLGQLQEVQGEFDDLLAGLIDGEQVIPMTGTGSMRFRFKHALLHEAAYASLLRDERRALHARALTVLKQSASGPAGGNREAEMAEHAWRAEAWSEAADLLARAGDRYAELSAYGLARTSYERARTALDAVPDDDRRLEARLALSLRLRPVLVPLGAYEDARSELDLAETLAVSTGVPDHLAKVLIGKSYLFSTHGRLPEAAETARRAIGLPATGSQLFHEAHLALGQALSLASDWRGTEAALLPGLDFWDAHPHERFGHTGTRAVWCYGMLANAFARKGDASRAEAYADRAMSLARETARPLDLVFALQRVADAKRLKGWTPESLALLEDAYQRAQDVDAPIFQVWFACDLAECYIALGQVDNAHALVNRQSRIADQLELRQFKAWIDLRRAELAFLEDRQDDATGFLDAALNIAETIGDRALEVACHRLRAKSLPHEAVRDDSEKTAIELTKKYGLALE